jgi:hypothetical protein
VIVLLDANVLMADPFCSGIAWKVLALGKPRWGVTVKIPKTALLEAVAGFQREIGYALEGLDKWHARYGRLRLKEHHAAASAGCTRAGEEYGERLESILGTLQAEIVDIPGVSLDELAARATRRQRPCDSKGDGFRDTLNWLTVMKVATDNPDEKIAWVSNDTGDFADDSGQALHPELAEELASAGLDDRVIFVPELKQLALMLAETPEERLTEVRKQLQEATLRGFVRHVLHTQVGKLIERHQLGVPLGMGRSGRIRSIRRPSDDAINLTVRGEVDGAAVVEFVAHTEMKLSLIVSQPQQNDVVHATARGGSLVRRIQPIEVTGLITTDTYHRPTTAEITQIGLLPAALDDHMRDMIKLSFPSSALPADGAALQQDETLEQPTGGSQASASMDSFEQAAASLPESAVRAIVASIFRAKAAQTLTDLGWSPPEGWEPVLGPPEDG